MPANLALDDNLIEKACRIGRHKSKKEAVTAALVEYVQRRTQLRIIEAFGSVEFDPKYDYKAERRSALPSPQSKNKTPGRCQPGV